MTKLKGGNSICDDTARKIYDFNDVFKDDPHETKLDIDEDKGIYLKTYWNFSFCH